MNETSSMSAGYAKVNGARLYYEVAGEGHPLVLVHAAIADHRMWNSQFAAFAQHYRVVRYDMRGFGQSEMVDGPFSALNDLYALLDYLGIDKAYLLGCSMGGSTAYDFTLQHPQMVDALIMVGSDPPGFEFTGEPPALWKEIVAAFKAGDMDKAAQLDAQLFLAGQNRDLSQIDPALVSLLLEMDSIALRNEKRRDANSLPALDPPSVTRVAEIHAPLLYIYGDYDDPNLARVGDLFAQQVTGAQVAMMPNTAHLPSMEQPDKFNQIVLGFLDRLPR